MTDWRAVSETDVWSSYPCWRQSCGAEFSPVFVCLSVFLFIRTISQQPLQ